MKHPVFLSILITLISLPLWASDDHDHKNSKAHQDESKEHDHEDNGSAAHKEEEHQDEGSQVGPDKGVLEADERHGIRLSPEAEKNFEIKRARISAPPYTVAAEAIVYAGKEENLFRYRGGFYKRIDFTITGKTNGGLLVQSPHLQRGDEIVTQGLGFLRIAEIAAFGGAAEGHSH